MTKKSVSQRIKITKSGKVLRRAMGLSHSRANKSAIQTMRKKRARNLYMSLKKIKAYL